jgi:hypothetical protein
VPFRVEVVRFRDLQETDACCRRVGLTAEQVRSLRLHPYARPEDPAGLLLLRGDYRAGRMGLLPGRIRIGGTESRVSWGSMGWEVDGDPRNAAGAGLLLLMAVREVGTFLGGGPSESARPVLERGRFEFLRLPRRALLLRSRAFLRRRLRSAAAAGAGAFVLDGLLRGVELARHAYSAARWSRRFRLEPVAAFDGRLDEIDAAARGGCCFPRDHHEINWAVRQPWLPAGEYRYHPFYLYGRGGVVGYALARVRGFHGLRLGSLLRAAVRTDAEGAAEALLDLVVGALDDERVDSVDVCTTNRLLLRAARRCGMLPRGGTEIVARFGRDTAATLQGSGATLADFVADLGEGDVIFN